MELLEEIRSRGWDERRRREFLRRYGPLICRSILYHLRRGFGAERVNGLAEHLQALQQGRHSQARAPAELLDLACNTWQDVLTESFKPKDNLIERFFEYEQPQGAQARRFEGFLKNAVRNAFWTHLRRLHRSPPLVKLETLEGEGERVAVQPPAEISVEDELLCCWDGLLRCQAPDAARIERELIGVRREPATVLVWACARLKEELRCKAEAMENLWAFMVFYASQWGPRRPGPPAGEFAPEKLCLEQVAGRYFRWEEDICQKIFKKSIRKDRVLELIRQRILASPYREMIEEGSRV